MSDFVAILKTPDTCPRCERSLKDDSGAALREIDRDFEGLRDRLDAQSLQRLKTGTIVCLSLGVAQLGGACLGPLLPLLPTIIFIQQIVWARPLISAPYARHFSPSRRMVTRWLSRFFVFTMASFHVHGAFPGFNFAQWAISPVIFVVTCGTTWAYHRFHLQRERDRQPILLVEKVVLVLAAVLALLAVAGLIVVAIVLGKGLEWISGQ